jgi:hypothetical protein
MSNFNVQKHLILQNLLFEAFCGSRLNIVAKELEDFEKKLSSSFKEISNEAFSKETILRFEKLNPNATKTLTPWIELMVFEDSDDESD